MRRKLSPKPIDLSGALGWIKSESNSILILILYFCGITAGATMTAISGGVRDAVIKASSFLQAVTASPGSVFLIGSLLFLACSTVLFGAGMCLIGYPCIYSVPFLFGAVCGAMMYIWTGGGEAIALLRCLLLLPFFSAAVSCLLTLCGYAADMNGRLISEHTGRDAEQEKKYAARFVVLTGMMLVCCVVQTALVLLAAHLK